MAVDNHHRIWRDGKFVDWEDATIHVMSHVVHYGSSVFEGIRCYETPGGPAVFRLPEHMRRLADSCRIYPCPSSTRSMNFHGPQSKQLPRMSSRTVTCGP